MEAKKHPVRYSFIRRNWILLLVSFVFIGNMIFINQPYDPDGLPMLDLLFWHADIHLFFANFAVLLWVILPVYMLMRHIMGKRLKTRYRGMITVTLLYVFLPVSMLVLDTFPRIYASPEVTITDINARHMTIRWTSGFKTGYTVYQSSESDGYHAIERGEGTIFYNVSSCLQCFD
ncbi:MAG: hypothetical protein ACPG7F_04615 [Aggregatilineales bacterium]